MKKNNNGMNERIRTLRKVLKLRQSDFGKQIGLTQTSLSMIERGTNTPTDKNIRLICSVFNVREEWLRTGNGKMFNDSPYIKELCEIISSLTPESQLSLLKIAREVRIIEERLLTNSNDFQLLLLFF